jgi:hypothetical protein
MRHIQKTPSFIERRIAAGKIEDGTPTIHFFFSFFICHETLHVSGIFCAHHQELSAVHLAIGMFHAGLSSSF